MDGSSLCVRTSLFSKVRVAAPGALQVFPVHVHTCCSLPAGARLARAVVVAVLLALLFASSCLRNTLSVVLLLLARWWGWLNILGSVCEQQQLPAMPAVSHFVGPVTVTTVGARPALCLLQYYKHGQGTKCSTEPATAQHTASMRFTCLDSGRISLLCFVLTVGVSQRKHSETTKNFRASLATTGRVSSTCVNAFHFSFVTTTNSMVWGTTTLPDCESIGQYTSYVCSNANQPRSHAPKEGTNRKSKHASRVSK